MHARPADVLLSLYREGVFPMAASREDGRIEIVDPDPRGVIPLESFRLSRRLARRLRSTTLRLSVDEAFAETLQACAAPGPGREETWISRNLEAVYLDLFEAGAAHSLECWEQDELVGGLYGVSIGAAFFGESMFSRRTDASKIALAHLAARLLAGGYRLLDAQFVTDHLRQFGAVEISRRAYRARLAEALARPADFFKLPPQTSGPAVLQAINQRS